MGLQINQLESVLQTDEAKEVLGAALLTTASAVGEDDVVHADDVDDNDDMIEGVLALNTTDASFQSDDIVRDEIEEDVSGVSREEGEEEIGPGTERASNDEILANRRNNADMHAVSRALTSISQVIVGRHPVQSRPSPARRATRSRRRSGGVSGSWTRR